MLLNSGYEARAEIVASAVPFHCKIWDVIRFEYPGILFASMGIYVPRGERFFIRANNPIRNI